METEVVVQDEHLRYQGSIDAILINEDTKEVKLYDTKTWGIAKKKWGLPNSAKKNSDKLKKVALQLSLYAETYRQKGYTVGGIYVVHLHDEEGAVEWSLDAKDHRQKEIKIKIWTSEEISELLAEYKKNEEKKEALKNNIKEQMSKKTTTSVDLPIEVEILLPTEQFGNIKVRLDLGKIDNGKTDKENIDALVIKAEYIRQACKKV